MGASRPSVSCGLSLFLAHHESWIPCAQQENRPLNVRPSALYRGYFMNVGSIVPVTCVQFGATRVMELALSGEGACPAGLRRSSPQPSPTAPPG